MKCYFNTPYKSEIKSAIINNIRKATFEINIAVYNFTDMDIINELKKFIRENNTQLNIFIDNSNLNTELDTTIMSQFELLQQRFPDQIKFKVSNASGLMHHKFIIIDRWLLGLGSYNFTNSADNYNYESFTFISAYQAPELIASYLKEFYDLMGLELTHPPISNVNIQIRPFYKLNGKKEYIQQVSNDTYLIIYPTFLEIGIQANHVMKVNVKCNDQNIISNFNPNKKNIIDVQPLYSQDIIIELYDWKSEVSKYKYPIQVANDVLMSEQCIKAFLKASEQVLQLFETHFDNYVNNLKI